MFVAWSTGNYSRAKKLPSLDHVLPSRARARRAAADRMAAEIDPAEIVAMVAARWGDALSPQAAALMGGV